jgi:L-ascorbate metabolism protein UlaG (beta-lactamase superfamily)
MLPASRVRFHWRIGAQPAGISESVKLETSRRVGVTWLGHATTLLELDGVRILTDPVLRDRIGPLVRLSSPPREEDAADIDAVLLSHLHYDHADLPSLARLPASTPVLAPRGAGGWLDAQGLRHVVELAAGEEASVRDVRVAATRAVHDGRRRPLGVSADPIGFVVSGSCSAYFAGDTDLFPEMADMAHSIDVALLPVAGWGPTVPEGHLNPERAAIAAALISPHLAVPMHWGTFGLWPSSLRPRDPERPAREFASVVARHAPAVEVRVLAPGERVEAPARSGTALR